MTRAFALIADENGCSHEAAAGYEAALACDPADLESTLNLAVLYWRAASGSGGPHGSDFARRARRRQRELLDSAGHRFPDRAEIRFWRHYIAAAESGATLELTECRTLLREHPAYLEPAFALFSNSAGAEAEAEAMRLLADYSERPTARHRYVTSMISAALRKQRWSREDCLQMETGPEVPCFPAIAARPEALRTTTSN